MKIQEEGEDYLQADITVYRQLFLNAAEGMVLTDHKGIILEINPKCSELFNYEADEILGKKIEMLIPVKSREKHREHRKNYVHKPENRSMGIGMNLAGQKKDGSIFPVEVSLNHFGKGDSLRVMALISDISKRVEVEKKINILNEKLEEKVDRRTRQLLQSQNLYVAIARNFPDGTISVFDKDLKYIFFEGRELYKAGIESDKLLGTSIKDRLPEDVKGKVIHHLEKVLQGDRGIIEFETKNQVFEINAVPLMSQDGSIDRILVVERNITKQKRAENEIINALEQERALNELKSRFVSMASHEFRTPLSTVLSSISLIERYNDSENSEKIDKHIGRIKSSVQNLTGILNDFLSLDKLEEGKVSMRPSHIKIEHTFRDIIDEMEGVLKKNQQIAFKKELDHDEAFIDVHIMKNILINLISNASKYSPEDSKIRLGLVVKGDKMKITVEDRGIGIPEEEQIHMFERFFRAKNVINIGGTGLGLNIVKKYVDLLEGDINFTSELEKGTIFTVELPTQANIDE